MWKCALLKKARKSIAKNCKLVFSGTVEKKLFWSWHNSMPENVVHYLNMKMSDILVEIIYLKLCSSIKFDGL